MMKLVLLVLATCGISASGSAPTFGGQTLDPSKGFHDSSHIPREPMVLVAADSHACMKPIEPRLHHIDALEDCEQSCFFESDCRYIAYNHKTKNCFMYNTCAQKDMTLPADFTVMHKKDPGVISKVEVSSGCSLDPGFKPMVVNYVGECSGVATASMKFNSRNDVLVNGVQYFPVSPEDGLVPVELYHDTPSVVSLQTLVDVEENDVPVTCAGHNECESNHWVKINVCVSGICREVSREYTVSLMDISVGNGDHASTNPADGARSKQTILIKPPDANDNIAVYAQVVQGYAGADSVKDAMAMVHNNKPLQAVCEHCNNVCARGEDDEWFIGHRQGLDQQKCVNSCYKDKDCVAVNYNKHDMVCDLFRTCHEKDMETIADAVIGPMAHLEKDPLADGEKAEKRMLASGELEEDAPAAPEPPKLLLKEDIAELKEKAEKAKNQKITNDVTGESEIRTIPKEFRRPPGSMSEYMVFRRPELHAPKYHKPDKHLLEFGGTEYGTIDMIGQTGTQNCILNAHAGGGTSDPNMKFARTTCTQESDNPVLYITGRGITPANFKCSTPMCESAKDFNCTDTTTVMVNPMQSIDKLGTMRDTIELSTQFSKTRNVMFTCTSLSLDKTIEHKVAFSLEFSDHNDFGKILEENMAQFNNPDLEEYNVGFPPKCRHPQLRGIFSDQTRCEQVPAVWNPARHNKVRYICPMDEDSDITVSPVVHDPSAKLELEGKIMRNMHHVTSTDGSHGGSHYGGVDFYFPVKGLAIRKNTDGNVRSWKLDTFCEEGGKTYDIIMQNGWNMKPNLIDIKISTGDNCKMTPDKIKPGQLEYMVECPGDTKYIGITPVLKDVGTRVIVNGDHFSANEEISPVRLEAGEEHVWDITFRPPIDPETKQVVFGYNATDIVHIQVVGVRYAPWGLGKSATQLVASICSIFGLGLAIISSANFVGVAKFLQFLGILVAIHGVPDAFKTFCDSFSKVNLQFDGLDAYIPSLKQMMPIDMKKFQKMAADAAGLPFRALKILQDQAAVGALELHHAIMHHGDKVSDKDAEEAVKAAAAAAKKKAEEIAAIRRKYRKQYLAFKEHLHKLKDSFKKEKGLLFNMFLLPILLSALGFFFIIRYFLRVFIPQGCYGYDWDQARVAQAKPNFILLFICDLGMIGFVKASSKIYCEGTQIDLYIPDSNGKWGMWHPPREWMNGLCLFLFFAYPVFFLYFTAMEIAKNQRNIVYNKALAGYADKEGCQEVRGSQPEHIPVPYVGKLLHKVNLAFSKEIKGISPILWAKNLKSEVIFDKTRKSYWIRGLGVMLDGRVKGSKLPRDDESKTEQESLDYVYQWEQIKVGKVENQLLSPFKEGDFVLRIGGKDDYEVDEFGMEKIGANGKRIVRMRDIWKFSMSELEMEMATQPWVEVKRKGELKRFQLPPPQHFGMFDVCQQKLTGMFKSAAKNSGTSGMDALAAAEAAELTKTSAEKFQFVHVSEDSSKKPDTRVVDRDYEVRVFVGTNGGRPFTFTSKAIPVSDGKGPLAREKLKRNDKLSVAEAVDFQSQGANAFSHMTESVSWEKAGGERAESVPHEMSAEWKQDGEVGQYTYTLNTKGADMRSDIIMDFTTVKKKVLEHEYDPALAVARANAGLCDADPMQALEDAKAGKAVPQVKSKTRFCQRIYSEPAKYADGGILHKTGMGSRKLVSNYNRKNMTAGQSPQDASDWKDVQNAENPWIRDKNFDGFYARRVLQVRVPEKLKVENAEGDKVSENFDHVAKVEIRGAGQCSFGESEVFLVLRSPNLSLKLDFKFTGEGSAFLAFLKDLKETPTPPQQAMERCVTSAVNEYWEKTKDRGGSLITDEFISIDTWKVHFGSLRVKPHIAISVDVDLERDGFIESNPGGGEKEYNRSTEELLSEIEAMFASSGNGNGAKEGFLKRYLKEVNELMQFKPVGGGDRVPMDGEYQRDLLGSGKLGIDTSMPGGVYLDAVKVIESLGQLQTKMTQIKFEDDFDHRCLEQALPRDTLEVWMAGPCYDGLSCSFKLATATMKCEKDPPRGKEKFVQVQLHSSVFCGRDQMDIERSDVVSKQLAFLTENPEELKKIEDEQKAVKNLVQGQEGYVSAAKEGYEPVPNRASTMSLDLGLPQVVGGVTEGGELGTKNRGKADLLEKVQLHKGVSPDGIPYRLSDAFEQYPEAWVGRKRFNVSVLGDFRYELAGKIQNKHIPILHWFTPDYVMEVPAAHLVFPRRDFYSHYYSQMKNNQRWNFLISRILILVSILMVIYMGKAKEAVNAESDALKDSLSHLTEHEKKLHVESLKKSAETDSGFQQLVALFFGTLLIFVSFAYPEIQEAYKEKEEERLEELKDQNKEERTGRCGLNALQDQLHWYMSSSEHRYFAIQAVYDGAAFSYGSQLILVALLISGHEGAPWTYKVPISLIAWLLILVTGFTLVRMNLQFLKDQWKKVKKQISEIDDRIIAEYEEKMKLYKEKKKQVLGFPQKIRDKIQEKRDQVTLFYTTIETKYKQLTMAASEMETELQKIAAEAERAKEELRKQGLVEEELSESETEESPKHQKKGAGMDMPLLGDERGMSVAEKIRRLEGDTGPEPKPSYLAPKHYGSGMGTGARAIEKQSAEELAMWKQFTLPEPVAGLAPDPEKGEALSWIEMIENEREEKRKSRPGVIKGKVAHMEIQAVTGLAQLDGAMQTGRFAVRALYNKVIYYFLLPFTYCVDKKSVSKFIKFGCAPAFGLYWVYLVTFHFHPGFIFWLILLYVGAQLAKKIYVSGVVLTVETEDDVERRKQEERNKKLQDKAKAMGVSIGQKVTSVHVNKVCEVNIDAKEHVKAALEAAEVVDSSWSKGEHQFNKMPPAMDLVSRKPIPDVNRGYFGLQFAHFQPANPPAFKDIGNTLQGQDLFEVRDYVFDYCDLIVDTVGLRVPAEMRPVRHTKTLTKKLMQVNKPLGTTRDLVKSFPIQVSVDFFAGKKNSSGDDEADTDNLVTQVVATLQVVNFVGKGEVDKPENDSYLTLTQTKKSGGKKGRQVVDLKRFKPDDELVFFDLKIGDLQPITVTDDDREILNIPRYKTEAIVEEARNMKPDQFLNKDDIVFEEEEQEEEAEEEGEEGQEEAGEGEIANVVLKETKPLEADPRAITEVSWSKRPNDDDYSGKRAFLVAKIDIHEKGPKKGEPCTDKEVLFKIRTEDDKLWLMRPIQAASGEILLKQEGELSPEQQKAKQCADWFMQCEEWYDFLGASVNLRANLHKCFDALFWGRDTQIKGGRPLDRPDNIRARFLDGKEKLKLPKEQRGVLARVLDKKDEGMTSRDYYDYLMYGEESDNEWPGFIHWFRAKPKQGRSVKQLNKNPIFHTGQVSDPGSIVETLAKPVLSPAVLHVVLTDTDLRAPGDVVEEWQPQRAEPHNVEMFMLDKNQYAEGQLGLLKLFPDKLQFEAPTGDDKFGSLSAMDDVVNFDFSDTYAMHAVVDDTFKKDKDGNDVLAVTGKTLYLQMKSGSIIAFGMSEQKIKMWVDLIDKYSMHTPQQILLGYDGEMCEHPEDPNIQIRNGKQGIQKWYGSSKGLGNNYCPRAKYVGSWDKHKYHGDGIYFKLQVCETPHHWAPEFAFQDAFHKGDPNHTAHTLAKFEREVVVYDGGFNNGMREGKGMLFFKVPVGDRQLLYRFHGIFVQDRPVIGELMHVDELPRDGVPFIKYYLGTVEPIGKKEREAAAAKKGKVGPLVKQPLLDISPWELYAACCISLNTTTMTPAQCLAKLKSDFGAYCSDPRRPMEGILKVLPRLNNAILRTKRTQGFNDEELSEFDLYVLSRALEPLKKLPLISQMMDPDEPGRVRTGEKVEDYKFTQRVTVKDYYISEHIQEDCEQLYNNWFKYDCVNDMAPMQGTTYAVDNNPNTKWESFLKGLDGMIEDWKKYRKEIPYEDACMLLSLALKKKPAGGNGQKPMRAKQAQEIVLSKLRQCLPHKDEAPSWYDHVSGDVYGEDHWESKEVFRSLHRKFCALNPTPKEFWTNLDTTIPVPVKRPIMYEDGTDLEFKTEFLRYMGRTLQVNGEVNGGEIKEFNEHQLGMFDHDECPWLQGKMHDSLKDSFSLNGFMKMRSIDQTKKGIDFAASIVNGRAHGQKARINSQKFSYEGDYKDGKFHGSGELVVRHHDHYSAFQGLRSYRGDWNEGKKHGYAVFEQQKIWPTLQLVKL
jgi:hypothetical protein